MLKDVSCPHCGSADIKDFEITRGNELTRVDFCDNCGLSNISTVDTQLSEYGGYSHCDIFRKKHNFTSVKKSKKTRQSQFVGQSEDEILSGS